MTTDEYIEKLRLVHCYLIVISLIAFFSCWFQERYIVALGISLAFGYFNNLYKYLVDILENEICK